MENKVIEEIIICTCGLPEHQLLFRTLESDSDVYVSVHLCKLPFLNRLKNGIKYIFGHTSKYGDFDEIIISPKDTHKLEKIVSWLKEHQNED